MKIFVFCGLIIWSPLGWSQTQSLQSTEEESKFLLSTGVLYSTASSSSGSFSGPCLNMNGSYLLNSKWGASFAFAQAFGQGGGLVSLYSAFQSSLNYSLWGSRQSLERNISVDGRRVLHEKVARSRSLEIGAGFDQVWFNGTTNVFPASGFAVSFAGCFKYGKYWIRPELRISSLTTGLGLSLMLTSVGAAFEF